MQPESIPNAGLPSATDLDAIAEEQHILELTVPHAEDQSDYTPDRSLMTGFAALPPK